MKKTQDMKKTQYYLELLRDEILNDVFNIVPDEPIKEYLALCVHEAYDTILRTALSDLK